MSVPSHSSGSKIVIARSAQISADKRMMARNDSDSELAKPLQRKTANNRRCNPAAKPFQSRSHSEPDKNRR